MADRQYGKRLLDGVISSDVNFASFSFMSTNEVKKLSVLEITNEASFDAFGNPVQRGLYDSSMGPLSLKEKCATCGLSFGECPGHCGHIELAVPVYHPFLFMHMFKILQRKCIACHR